MDKLLGSVDLISFHEYACKKQSKLHAEETANCKKREGTSNASYFQLKIITTHAFVKVAAPFV